MFRVVILATFGYPVLNRAFYAPLLLRSGISFPVRRWRLRAVDVSFYYFDLHKGVEARRVFRGGKLFVFDFSFLPVSSAIRSPGPHLSATQSFSSVAKLTPRDRSFVKRQSVV